MAQQFVLAIENDSDSLQSSSNQLSRSPRPYHRRGSSLRGDHVQETRDAQFENRGDEPLILVSSGESGTEADDERGRLLKGLPPPPLLKVHKGLRDEPPKAVTPIYTPLWSPPWLEVSEGKPCASEKKNGFLSVPAGLKRQKISERYTKKRRLAAAQRITEIVLFFTVCSIVTLGHLSRGSVLQLLNPGEIKHKQVQEAN